MDGDRGQRNGACGTALTGQLPSENSDRCAGNNSEGNLSLGGEEWNGGNAGASRF